MKRGAQQVAEEYSSGESPVMNAIHPLFKGDEGALTWPELPEEALHGISGSLVELATNNTEADPAGVLITTLTWASALFGAHPVHFVGDTEHYPRLFSVLVGQTSKSRKGTTISPVKRILSKAEILDPITQKGLRIRYGGLSSAEGLIFVVRDCEDTDEGGANDKRLLCIETEFGKVFRMMQRQGNTIADILKQAWDGGDLGTLTKKSPITSSNPHICIVGHITQAELEELLTPAVIWSGLGNRFLWCCVQRKGFQPDPQPMPGKSVAEIARRFQNAFLSAKGIERIDWGCDEVKNAWRASYEELSEGGIGTAGAMTGRGEAQVRRLAMVYALLDESASIGLIHLEAALAVWKYCEKSGEYLFGTDDPNADAANRIMQHFEDLPNAELSRTKLGTLLGKDKTRKDKAIRQLLGSGQIESFAEKTTGRPRTMYRKKRKKEIKP